MLGHPHLGWWILMVILILFAFMALGGQFYGVSIPGSGDPGDPATWKKEYPKWGGGAIIACAWGGLAALVGYHIHSVSKKAPAPAAAPAAAPPAEDKKGPPPG